eukprot:m.15331 g.15331  ORF g.15331 m.15331 type:complete len:99 (-) comp6557_c0_seq1:847-1143(-)
MLTGVGSQTQKQVNSDHGRVQNMKWLNNPLAEVERPCMERFSACTLNPGGGKQAFMLKPQGYPKGRHLLSRGGSPSWYPATARCYQLDQSVRPSEAPL